MRRVKNIKLVMGLVVSHTVKLYTICFMFADTTFGAEFEIRARYLGE